MFYDKYLKKSNNELIEILNSDSYQLLAREAAQKILEERQVKYEINDEKPSLQELNCFQLFDKLEQFSLNVFTSKRKKLIEINQDNYGLISGILFFVLSSISLTITLTIISEIYSGTYFYGAGARAYILKGCGIGAVLFFIVGLMNYQRDKKSSLKINFIANSIEIKQRKIWKRENFKFQLNESKIGYKKTGKKYKVFIPYKSRKIILFDFKDNNIGNKTEEFLSIMMEKLNDHIKNSW